MLVKEDAKRWRKQWACSGQSRSTSVLPINHMIQMPQCLLGFVNHDYSTLVTEVHSRFKCIMSHICLRLMRCHWSCNLWWVKILKQLGPWGFTSYFVNNRCSESKLRVWLVLEVLARLIVWENLSWEFPKFWGCLIIEMWLVLESRWYISLLLVRILSI